MVNTSAEGRRLHKLLWKNYDIDYGGAVIGVSGSQGSVKTTACLDLAEKKMINNHDELVFWRETFDSPMQCRRIIDFDCKYFVEDGLDIVFINTSAKEEIHPQVTVFKNLTELYDKAETQCLNVVFFDSVKSWTHLIKFLNSDIRASGDTQSVFLDEMEGLYPAGTDNQSKDKWWSWMRDSGEVIKECRKSRTFVIGNYHDDNLIDYRIMNKFMFYMYGFGARVPGISRVKQCAVDQLKMGEFYIDQAHTRFGKIRIKTFHPSSLDRWIVRRRKDVV